MADNLPARRQPASPKGFRLPRTEYTLHDVTPPRRPASAGPRPPKTEYVYVQDRGKTRTATVGGKREGGKLPAFLANREVIFGAWVVAMAFVCWDEWKNYGILPRPARLWYTTLLYGILALVSQISPLVPVCNAIAIGFDFTLIYQYYNHTGQFADSGSTAFQSAQAGAAGAALGTLAGFADAVGTGVGNFINTATGTKASAPSGPAASPVSTTGASPGGNRIING